MWILCGAFCCPKVQKAQNEEDIKAIVKIPNLTTFCLFFWGLAVGIQKSLGSAMFS